MLKGGEGFPFPCFCEDIPVRSLLLVGEENILSRDGSKTGRKRIIHEGKKLAILTRGGALAMYPIMQTYRLAFLLERGGGGLCFTRGRREGRKYKGSMARGGGEGKGGRGKERSRL